MKAMRFRPFGGLDTLEQVESATPFPGPGEVLIQVAAVSINPVDWKLRCGALRWIAPLWFSAIPCFDYAGRVAAAGSGVDSPRVGDRVFGLCRLGRTGSACEFILARPEELAAIPANVSFEQAAGVPLAGMTALQALQTPEPARPGERVIIVGASGGVGHLAVQIAKAMDLSVTAVCSTPNVDWVRALGADRVLDYSRGEADQPSPEYDRVFDAVSLGSLARWRQWLKPAGSYVVLLPRLDVLLHAWNPVDRSRLRAHSIGLKPSRSSLDALTAWMAGGRLRTVIDSVYPFDAFGEALERSRAGHVRGKIVVRVSEA